MTDIHLKITDREGLLYEIEAPTDMNMSLMEVMRAYEIAQDGEIGVCGGMAMCASCQCYVPKWGKKNKLCFLKLST